MQDNLDKVIDRLAEGWKMESVMLFITAIDIGMHFSLLSKNLTKQKNSSIIVVSRLEVKIKLIKLDYTLTSPEERQQLVEKFLEENPNPGEKYLEILADYLVLCMEKQEKKEKKILTDNRMTTVNKRETSFDLVV